MEVPLPQISPQGNRQTPSPTFSTFLPTDLSGGGSQGPELPLKPRPQALEPEEAQGSPTAVATQASASLQALGAVSSPDGAAKAEEVPGEGGLALQAEIRAWFQKTQAHWLLQHAAAPAWFHGFITRREAERLLEAKPQGCFLVRFSESAITFVLTYRSQTRCRHFLLAQLPDGRHVVLGEDSAHTRLQDLLRHYTACPLSPYGEKLTEPCARQTPEPAGLCWRTEDTDSASNPQARSPQYSAVLKHRPAPAPAPKEAAAEPKEPSQPPRPKPPLPAKPQLPPEVYASPAPRLRPAPPRKPSPPIYNEPDEPIAFYAMGRGSPGEAPSNIYAELEALSGREQPRPAGGHPALRKCRSRPAPESQNPGGPKLHSENSVAGQPPPLAHQSAPPGGHTLPHNLSRQALQDRGQPWPSLGSPR
ncbi:SH2 domain-containing protein 2A isoform X2 [Echinops telfairi]|uniref:SH2 domain-containing protein 2A isoform X2 n=1 Tax=Echinops telfairi TaxID=9371 RepID=A0ABM1VME4_ECHTE|nr:SH2 domain-containing protein 2A isoform X2 [Echinops telfairi]